MQKPVHYYQVVVCAGQVAWQVSQGAEKWSAAGSGSSMLRKIGPTQVAWTLAVGWGIVQ